MDIRECGTTWWWWHCWPTPLSQLPKPLMALRSYSGSSHVRNGVFHISLRTHKAQPTQPRVWKKREQINIYLGSLEAQEVKSFWDFCVAFRASAGYCERVFEQNSHKVTRNADSSSHVGQPSHESSHPALSSRQPCSVHFSVLLPSLFCSGTFLPSSSPGLGY